MLRWSVLIKHPLLSLLAPLKPLPWAISEFHLAEGLKLLFGITLEQLSTALSLLGNAGKIPVWFYLVPTLCWWSKRRKKTQLRAKCLFWKDFPLCKTISFFHPLFLGSFGVWITIFAPAHCSMSFWKHFMVSLGHIFILIMQVLRLKQKNLQETLIILC